MNPRRRQRATIASMLFVEVAWAMAARPRGKARTIRESAAGDNAARPVCPGGDDALYARQGVGVSVAMGTAVGVIVGTGVGVSRDCSAMSNEPDSEKEQFTPVV
jgi:hypothetical protein